jgi:hypothetical protein
MFSLTRVTTADSMSGLHQKVGFILDFHRPGAKGAKQTAETRTKRQLAAAGRDVSHLHTPEVRRKATPSIAKALTGRTPTAETRERLSAAKQGEKHNFWGKRHSQEAIANMIVAQRARARAPVTIAGIDYWGITGAARSLGVSNQTIHRWIKSGKATYTNR